MELTAEDQLKLQTEQKEKEELKVVAK